MPRADKPNVMGPRGANRARTPDLSTAFRPQEPETFTAAEAAAPQTVTAKQDAPPVKTTILIPEHLHRRLRRFKTEDRVPIAAAIVYALEQTYPTDELPDAVPRKGQRP